MSMDGLYAVFAGAKNCRQRLKQLFHYSDGHGGVGLLVATGQKTKPALAITPELIIVHLVIVFVIGIHA
ncbi:MAG: hypothetical protein ABJI60_04655 [Kangiellaceae bacterium]